jgi:peptidoglycan/LPS O-acetylase OafA/YrhL
LLGGYPLVFAPGSLYRYLKLQSLSDDVNLSIYVTLGATLLVYSCLTIPIIKKFLCRRKVSILGRYTFSLYLIHLPILLSLSLTLFALLAPLLGYNCSVFVSLLITAPVIILVTWLFERFIDAPSIRLAGRFSSLFEGKSKGL